MLSGKPQLKLNKDQILKCFCFENKRNYFFVRSDYKNTNLNAFSSIHISFIIYSLLIIVILKCLLVFLVKKRHCLTR